MFAYGLTDRLTVQAVPGLNDAWNGTTTSRGLVGSDLPIDLKYRFRDQVADTPVPSASVSLGVSVPTGPYEGLPRARLAGDHGDGGIFS